MESFFSGHVYLEFYVLLAFGSLLSVSLGSSAV